jgi:SsrA-binding protein
VVAKKKQSGQKEGVKVAAVNKKARRDYEILATWEAGLQLVGSEVKSIREGSVNLKESYVREIRGELFLIGCHVSAYSHQALDGHETLRERKLLLHKREIEILGSSTQKKGLTIVPLRLYFKNGRCKLEIGTGRGRKLHDKRQVEKSKQADRQIERAMKKYS